jgi:DNA-binding MarR family transcriptional regulator
VRLPELTQVRLQVLSLLGNYGQLPIGEVASRSEMHPSTMTRVIDALERRGLVVRSVDPRDRRAVMVALSEAGAHELEVARGYHSRMVVEALGDLTQAERDLLVEGIPLLLRVSEALRPAEADVARLAGDEPGA